MRHQIGSSIPSARRSILFFFSIVLGLTVCCGTWLDSNAAGDADIMQQSRFAFIQRLDRTRPNVCGFRASRLAARVSGKTPDVVDAFNIAGRLPGDPIAERGKRADNSLSDTLDFATDYFLNGTDSSGRSAWEAVQRWLRIFRPSYNPINEGRLDKLIISLDLLKARDPDYYRNIDLSLIQTLASRYTKRAQGVALSAIPYKHNNWQAYRIKIAALAAFATGDTADIEAIHEQFKLQIDESIAKDGTLIDFVQRDAIHYVVYALEPMLMVAIAAKNHGQDWYSYRNLEGAGLADALSWLEKYATGETRHVEFGASSIDFDKVRKAAGVEGFGGEFQPEKAHFVMALASRLDDRFSRWRDHSVPIWLQVAVPTGLRCL